MQRLSDLGENGLVQLLAGHWRGGRDVRVGVGDDCAVLRYGKSRRESLLYKTDAIVESVHFTPKEKPALIGRKALARAVSDIAAMGGEPWAAVVTIGAPAHTPVARLRGIYRGLETMARNADVALVGGETTRSQQLFLSISLLGKVRGYEPVLRSTGKAGDLLFVTGKLGGSIGGRHLRFTPRLREGQWLARRGYARSMMDLSDGLGADLPRLAAASAVNYRIERDALPCHRGVTPDAALNDGEDYELLFSVAPDRVQTLLRHWPFATTLTCIGAFTSLTSGCGAKGRATSTQDLTRHDPASRLTQTRNDLHGLRGFDHFRQP